MENVNKKNTLVEDDLNFGAVLKDYLMLNDFDVTLAKNGMEGFEKFKRIRMTMYSGCNDAV
jgi:DNA-binding response OmpR family regulator